MTSFSCLCRNKLGKLYESVSSSMICWWRLWNLSWRSLQAEWTIFALSLSLTRLLLDVTISGFCVQPTTEEEFCCNKFAKNPPELSCESFLVTRIFARREKNMKIYSILLLPISLDGCPFRKPSHSKHLLFFDFTFCEKSLRKLFFLLSSWS